MRKLVVLLYFLSLNSLLFADVSKEEFTIIDRCDGKIFRVGNKLGHILEMYPNIAFRGEKKYSNITYREYQGEGIVFSISAYTKSEMDANVLVIEILSNAYSTRKGLVVGNNRNDVVSQYGEPNYIRKASYYYYNREDDLMMLEFSFDDRGLVNSIILATGT